MKTVVYQSFRTDNVPGWIQTCLNSVRSWAEHRGFAYRFWDDRFFDLVPEELRPRASSHVCLLSDYARLAAARDLLGEGFDRVVWVDADIVVLDPDKFTVDLASGFSFCREVWHDRTFWGRPFFKLSVNNSVSVFCRDETVLDPYLNAAQALLAGSDALTPASLGTHWLTAFRRRQPFPLLTSVGILSPEMMYRFLQQDADFLRRYLRFQTSPVYAVNLCHSYLGSEFKFSSVSTPWRLSDAVFSEVVERLRAEGGASLNRHFDHPYVAPRDEFPLHLSRLRYYYRRLHGLSLQPPSFS